MAPIKLDPIGTLIDTLTTTEMAKRPDYTCLISHRPREAEETFIVDLAGVKNEGQKQVQPPTAKGLPDTTSYREWKKSCDVGAFGQPRLWYRIK